MLRVSVFFSLMIILLAVPVYGEEEEAKSGSKVKTGVEVEKGDKAPAWDTEILERKKEKKKRKEELKKERKEEMKKERKERKMEQKKERSERKKQKRK